jgi:hypothetical protein
VEKVEKEAGGTIQILMGGDFNATLCTEGEHSNRTRDKELTQQCDTRGYTWVRPAAARGRSRPISFQRWSTSAGPDVQSSLLDHFFIRMSDPRWKSASAVIGPRPFPSKGDMDHFPIHLRTGSALLPPPPPSLGNKTGEEAAP